MIDTAASEAAAAEPETEADRRARLIHWIKYAMWRQKNMSVAKLAKGLGGVPESTLHRWLDPDETAPFPMVYLGPLCRALRVDPVVFALLRPIPADPLAPYLLEDDSEVALDVERLALLDTEAAAASAPRADDGRPGEPRTAAGRARP